MKVMNNLEKSVMYSVDLAVDRGKSISKQLFMV